MKDKQIIRKLNRLIDRVSEVDKDMHRIFEKVSQKNKNYEEKIQKDK